MLGLALQRLQAHTPGARRIQGGSARALLAAHREGLTPDELGAVCRWLDGAPGWAATLRERGQAVDSWAVVLGRDWRGLVAQARRWEADGCPEVEAARLPPTARGSPGGRGSRPMSFAEIAEEIRAQAARDVDAIEVLEVTHG